MSIGTFLHTCLIDAQKAIHAVASFFGAAQPFLDGLAADAIPLIKAIDPQAGGYAEIAIKLFDGAAAVARNADGSITVTHTVEVANQIDQLVKDSKAWLAAAAVPKP